MQIEILGPQYAKEIFSIINEYQKQLSDIAQLNWNLESIHEILKSERAIGLIKHANEQNTGSECLAFIIYKDLIDVAEILLLGTSFKSQSQGLMKVLFKSLKTNYPEIWLEVHELNTKAQRLYEKESFKLDRVRPKYYTDAKAALVMSWKRDLAIC